MFKIKGLSREPFTQYFSMDAEGLARNGALRVTADADRGFPCRVSLEDAQAGESLILINFVSHDVANPYRTACAIYVREQAHACVRGWIDCLPPVFAGRTLSLRGFDAGGMLRDAQLAAPGEAEQKIRAVFEDPAIECIHAHNAAYGCFAARIDRHGDGT